MMDKYTQKGYFIEFFSIFTAVLFFHIFSVSLNVCRSQYFENVWRNKFGRFFFFIKSEDYCDVSTMAPCHILNPQSLLHEDLKQSNSKTRNQYFYKICKKKRKWSKITKFSLFSVKIFFNLLHWYIPNFKSFQVFTYFKISLI